MKKKVVFNISIILAFVCLFVLVLSSCGKAEKSKADSDASLQDFSSAINNDGSSAGSQEIAPGDVKEDTATTERTQRKLVTTVSVRMETTEYDSFVEKLKSIVSSRGGYLESASADGKTPDRYGKFTVRIPEESRVEFTGEVSGMGNVLSSSENTEDITLSYVDTQSRITALQTERDSLLALLEKANSVDNIITIQSRLSDVNYQLESYQSQMRVYDNQVEYATISLYLIEVERESSQDEGNIWAQIGNHLSDNFGTLGRFLKVFFVGFVSAIPFFLIPLGITVIVLLIIFLPKRRKKKEKLALEEKKEQPKSIAK